MTAFSIPGRDKDLPGFMIFRAMCLHAATTDTPYDLRELFKMDAGAPTVDVVMTVNGIEVDIMGALNTAWGCFDERVNAEANNRIETPPVIEEIEDELRSIAQLLRDVTCRLNKIPVDN